MKWLLRAFVFACYWLGAFFRKLRPQPRVPEGQPVHLLLTGTFHSQSWIDAFVAPLLACNEVSRVTLVTTLNLPEQEKLTIIYPPQLLRRLFGQVGARLLSFCWAALRRKPQIIGGFYIAPNALLGDLLACMTGARSLYYCVGGPLEIIDGGLRGESRLLDQLKEPDGFIEAYLIKIVKRHDLVIPMGSRAVQWFESQGVQSQQLAKMTGAIASNAYRDDIAQRPIDLIFVGRLEPIKDLPLLVDAIGLAAEQYPSLRVKIVGRGSQAPLLKQWIAEKHVEKHVEITGFVDDVFEAYRSAKCFILTSISEGVSLAMLEAMMSATVPIVADVGDLKDLVREGQNGCLVPSRDPADFAQCICQLLANPDRLGACSKAAWETASQYSVPSLASQWDQLIPALFSEASGNERI